MSPRVVRISTRRAHAISSPEFTPRIRRLISSSPTINCVSAGPRRSHVERGETAQLGGVAFGLELGADQHQDASMGAGGGVLLEPGLHLGALAAQLAAHDRDIEAAEVGACGVAFGAQLAQLIAELRGR